MQPQYRLKTEMRDIYKPGISIGADRVVTAHTVSDPVNEKDYALLYGPGLRIILVDAEDFVNMSEIIE